jgi:pyridoxamine 5'-phosphate oxidase
MADDPLDPLPPLDVATVAADPMEQFAGWYEAARVATGDRAAAMTVATATPDGRPSARVVLLRGVDARGFVFFTNYDSRKGGELAANAVAAAVLYWSELDAQVRIEGEVERVGVDESDDYFAHRPRGHQIGAWASHQSAPVADRAALEAQVRSVEAQFPDAVPRPPHWGGYRIVPDTVEFWRNRRDRVHDRVEYTRRADGWRVRRLSP